ncbi:hypothetical protein AVEN_205062-1 [Araneus ventricosus]|uniref:Uncharacterized protein n=1 Tax=Araneus ventricosus TaxID=182803 RepID=A0A4Y2ISN1_ARAVE|nr:hypothetical protein AVEN_205062-1 [Araneus ventricosus]
MSRLQMALYTNGKSKKYKEMMKDEVLKSERSLILEFDYAQNLPLPKLPGHQSVLQKTPVVVYVQRTCSRCKHSGLLHVPLNERSCKKGASTVCFFLYHVIKMNFHNE